MVNKMMFVLLKQVAKKPATNPFPVKHAPKNVTELIEKVQKGEAQINPQFLSQRDSEESLKSMLKSALDVVHALPSVRRMH